MTDRYHARKGDDALVLIDRDDLAPESFLGKTGHVLAVNPDGDCLLKFRGRAQPVSFPRVNLALRCAS